MIEIKRSDNKIIVSGHAGYSTIGQDVVCAAISTLLQAFYWSMEELTNDEIKADFRPGNAVIEYGNLSKEATLLVDSFFVGVKMVAGEFPDYVRVS